MSDSEILRGVPAIRAFMNAIMDAPLSERQVYTALELGQIPSKKLLGQYIVSKTAIRTALGADSDSAPTTRTKRSVI